MDGLEAAAMYSGKAMNSGGPSPGTFPPLPRCRDVWDDDVMMMMMMCKCYIQSLGYFVYIGYLYNINRATKIKVSVHKM